MREEREMFLDSPPFQKIKGGMREGEKQEVREQLFSGNGTNAMAALVQSLP